MIQMMFGFSGGAPKPEAAQRPKTQDAMSRRWMQFMTVEQLYTTSSSIANGRVLEYDWNADQSVNTFGGLATRG